MAGVDAARVGLGEALCGEWRRSLAVAGFMPQAVPAEFASRRNGGGAGPISLEFSRMASPQGHEWRQTLIRGPRVEILCAMGFPGRSDLAPVFAAETIAFNGSTKIAVVDLECAGDARLARQEVPWWGELMNRLGGCLSAGELELVQSSHPWPEWAHHCFSERVIYCRPEARSDEEEIRRVLVQGGLKYHEFWLDWLKRVDEREWKRGDGEKGWDDYRRHHCLNTPGRPFLTAQFGAEWTEEFLAKQMYGPAAMVGLPEDLAAAS